MLRPFGVELWNSYHTSSCCLAVAVHCRDISSVEFVILQTIKRAEYLKEAEVSFLELRNQD